MADNTDHQYMRGRLSGVLERWRFRRASQYIKTGDHVLDLACNEGGLIPFLPESVEYLGIDINEMAIKRAASRFSDHKFRVANLIESLPTMDRQFDVVVMLAFLEHVADPESVLKAAREVLNANGRILVTTPSPWGRGVHDLGARIGLFSREAAEEHETFLGKSAIYRLGDATALQIETFRYFMFGFNQFISFKKQG